jgi:hypothetical protein
MSKSFRWSAEDWMGLWMVAILGGGAFAFRLLAIAPRATVGMCAAANAPAICVPRHAVLTLQYYQGFGWAALVLGLAAFFLGKRTLAVLALGIGIAAVVNYNPTTGIIGAAFGLITWLGLATGRYAGRA